MLPSSLPMPLSLPLLLPALSPPALSRRGASESPVQDRESDSPCTWAGCTAWRRSWETDSLRSRRAQPCWHSVKGYFCPPCAQMETHHPADKCPFVLDGFPSTCEMPLTRAGYTVPWALTREGLLGPGPLPAYNTKTLCLPSTCSWWEGARVGLGQAA